MKYSVYVVKCESEKYWVGFTQRELDVYLQRMVNGKGPSFTKEYAPLDIVLICESNSVEKAEILNVIAYDILSKVMGPCNVKMDSKRYKKVSNFEMENNIKCLLSTENKFTSSLLNQSKKELDSNSNIDSSKRELSLNSNGKFIVYSLLCNKNARYIGMTTNLAKTYSDHKNGNMGSFTKGYKPKKLEFEMYYDNEMDAKMGQIELLDDIRVKYGSYIKTYTEFINSKPDIRVVWEDIIPTAKEELFENTPNGPEIKYWVYVLGCEESNYYVGFTSNLRERFKSHSSEIGGANFTYEFLPLLVLHIEGHKNMLSAKMAEKNWTLDLKKMKGKDNVFGFWEISTDPYKKMYFGHELLENWVIKNPNAYSIDNFD